MRKAHEAEVNNLEELRKFAVIERKEERIPIPFIGVLTDKLDNITGLKKYKVRLAARRDLVETIRGEECYFSTSKPEDMRVFVTAMRALKCYVLQADCPSAYFNGVLDEAVILHLPKVMS